MDNIIRSINQLQAEKTSIAGGKGGSLARLSQAGFTMPDGFVIPAPAFANGHLKPEAWTEVRAYLGRMRTRRRDVAFAVCSSALSVDSAQASFAGNFETVLIVQTNEEVRSAIQSVYDSRQSEHMRAHSQAKGTKPTYEVAVVVQELVRGEISDILSAVCRHSEAANDIYGALVSGVIPAAWISEGLFTIVYNTLIKRRGDPAAPTYLMGFDSTSIRAEKSLYDLGEWVRTRAGLVTYLGNTPTSQLTAQLGNNQTPPGVNGDDWREWKSRFDTHLQLYGHTVYNLDFASPVPADDPAPLLETFKLFISGRGANPYARQQAAAERREQATQAMLKRLKGPRLRLFRRFLTSAQRYAPLRQEGLADVGLSYPLLRQMLLEVDRRFAGGGMVEKPVDIYWLKQDEVEQATTKLDHGAALGRLTTTVRDRKAAWRAAKRVTPPRMLPQLRFPRMDLKTIKPARAREHTADIIKGVAASPGSVTAPARVLHGLEEFDHMKAGDVLVAPITTAAWTPLFARAAAIVTDVGGPLSHGSIAGRDYGIPAVLGTGVATKRINSGQEITVDGSAGVVSLSNM